MSPLTTLAAEIKQHARALGFDLVGITGVRPPPHLGPFRQWLERGWHGTMGYLARRAAERADPATVLPGARSIVVVGLNYWTGATPAPAPSPATAAGLGRVARYAQGAADYHDLMGDRLRRLALALERCGGRDTVTKWYVDTGPILERDLAQRAGIGFVGKHTNLISRQFGNWILLGEVLTTLELPPDQSEREYCGTCHRCLDACPTGAIVAPYQLDARLCLSYLTIELKGAIPVELRPLIGDRIFGCDDCLEACPWNRFARLSPVQEFQRRPLPPLAEFLSWDDARFRAFFRGTPIFRLKRRGFRRNVCVALGNVGDASARPALACALRDADPLVREHAAWADDQIRQRGSRDGARSGPRS